VTVRWGLAANETCQHSAACNAVASHCIWHGTQRPMRTLQVTVPLPRTRARVHRKTLRRGGRARRVFALLPRALVRWPGLNPPKSDRRHFPGQQDSPTAERERQRERVCVIRPLWHSRESRYTIASTPHGGTGALNEAPPPSVHPLSHRGNQYTENAYRSCNSSKPS